jgi:hypothetical protein
MPNHVTNKVTFLGKEAEIKILLDAIGNKEDVIDFEKIIPMPKVLHGISSPPRIVSEKEYKKEMEGFADRKKNPTDIDKLMGITHSITQKIADSYIKKYGACDWYAWSCEHWGTKWNAYEQSKGEMIPTNSGIVKITLEFQTAWSPPYPVIVELAKRYPNIRMELKWADEDWGSNVGKCDFASGVCTDEYMPAAGSKEAYELCFELIEGSRDYFELVDGKYEYNEESEN